MCVYMCVSLWCVCVYVCVMACCSLIQFVLSYWTGPKLHTCDYLLIRVLIGINTYSCQTARTTVYHATN